MMRRGGQRRRCPGWLRSRRSWSGSWPSEFRIACRRGPSRCAATVPALFGGIPSRRHELPQHYHGYECRQRKRDHQHQARDERRRQSCPSGRALCHSAVQLVRPHRDQDPEKQRYPERLDEKPEEVDREPKQHQERSTAACPGDRARTAGTSGSGRIDDVRPLICEFNHSAYMRVRFTGREAPEMT